MAVMHLADIWWLLTADLCRLIVELSIIWFFSSDLIFTHNATQGNSPQLLTFTLFITCIVWNATVKCSCCLSKFSVFSHAHLYQRRCQHFFFEIAFRGFLLCLYLCRNINNLQRTLNNEMNLQCHSPKNESHVLPEGRDSDSVCKMITCVAREI